MQVDLKRTQKGWIYSKNGKSGWYRRRPKRIGDQLYFAAGFWQGMAKKSQIMRYNEIITGYPLQWVPWLTLRRDP